MANHWSKPFEWEVVFDNTRRTWCVVSPDQTLRLEIMVWDDGGSAKKIAELLTKNLVQPAKDEDKVPFLYGQIQGEE